MTDRDAMLRAIAANPDEDTPRLAYADLLDEVGGEANIARARFIRLQIDLVRNPGRSWFANADRLSEASRLVGLFAERWLEELPQWARGKANQERLGADDFSRGFLHTCLVRPKEFARYGHQLLEVAPITRIIAPNLTKQTDLVEFLGSPILLRIRSLSLSSANGDQITAAIRSSWRSLAALEELDLSDSGLTNVDAASLAQASLPNLQILSARKSRLTEAGAERLLLAKNLPKLKLLDIRGTIGGYRWVSQLQSRFPGKQILVY